MACLLAVRRDVRPHLCGPVVAAADLREDLLDVLLHMETVRVVCCTIPGVCMVGTLLLVAGFLFPISLPRAA